MRGFYHQQALLKQPQGPVRTLSSLFLRPPEGAGRQTTAFNQRTRIASLLRLQRMGPSSASLRKTPFRKLLLDTMSTLKDARVP